MSNPSFVRRLLASVLALALCAFAAPPSGAEDYVVGTLVVVSTGPGEGTVTLPPGLTAWGDPAMTGSSPYVLIGMSAPGKQETFGVARYPGMTYRQWDDTGRLPAGRSTVRMLAVGPTTVRIPVRGMRGTRTVRLDRKLREGLVDVRTIPVRDVHVLEDVIPFTLPGRSVLAHGVVRHALVSTIANDETCTTMRGSRCGGIGISVPPETPMAYPGGDEWLVLHNDFWAGPGDAVMRFTQAAVYPDPVTHFLLVLPMP